MAKKKSFFGTLLKLGGIAAATAVVYNNREAIRDYLGELAERYAPSKTDEEAAPVEEEPRIVIDATGCAEKLCGENTEDGAEN